MRLAGSFQRVPIRKNKYYLRPEVARALTPRIFPTFVNLKAYPLDAYSAIAPAQSPETVLSFFFDKQYYHKGLEFRGVSYNGYIVIYASGFPKHTLYSVSPRRLAQTCPFEVTGNGEVLFATEHSSYHTVHCRPHNNYEATIKVPKRGGRADLEDILITYRFKNETGDLSWHLPDFGGRIK